MGEWIGGRRNKLYLSGLMGMTRESKLWVVVLMLARDVGFRVPRYKDRERGGNLG